MAEQTLDERQFQTAFNAVRRVGMAQQMESGNAWPEILRAATAALGIWPGLRRCPQDLTMPTSNRSDCPH
jgi:hypothetical protein